MKYACSSSGSLNERFGGCGDSLDGFKFDRILKNLKRYPCFQVFGNSFNYFPRRNEKFLEIHSGTPCS